MTKVFRRSQDASLIEQRFDVVHAAVMLGISQHKQLNNPPKILKCRMIVMALHSIANPTVMLDKFPETHGEVKDLMRSTLKHIDPQYEKALTVLNQYGCDRMRLDSPIWTATLP